MIIVRKGNPKHITGWDDLIKPGVERPHAEPVQLGQRPLEHRRGLRRRAQGGQDAGPGRCLPDGAFHNVVSQDTSARNALQTFLAGKGDALIDYESEAIADQKKGAAISYVIPKQTILIQNPIAITSSRRTRRPPRPSSPTSSRRPARRSGPSTATARSTPGVAAARSSRHRPSLFTIATLGGWPAVNKQFFDPTTGIVTKIEQSLGVVHDASS